jgi:hypothetical protein
VNRRAGSGVARIVARRWNVVAGTLWSSPGTHAVTPSPCVEYDNCDAGYPVIWCEVAGGTHAIPSFSATAMANFLKQF